MTKGAAIAISVGTGLALLATGWYFFIREGMDKEKAATIIAASTGRSASDYLAMGEDCLIARARPQK